MYHNIMVNTIQKNFVFKVQSFVTTQYSREKGIQRTELDVKNTAEEKEDKLLPRKFRNWLKRRTTSQKVASESLKTESSFVLLIFAIRRLGWGREEVIL